MGAGVNVSAILVAAGGFAPLGAMLGAIGMLLVNRNNAVKLLSEAQQIAQTTALQSMRDGNESLRKQCTDCQVRLTEMELDLRQTKAALRATVRALDKNDPGQLDTAITAARELI